MSIDWIIIVALAWLMGNNMVLAIEAYWFNYRHIGMFSWPKLVSLILLWPIIYPLCIITGGAE